MLALAGGYVDVVCIVRYQTFVVTMTGNLVITGQTLFEVMHHFIPNVHNPRGHAHVPGPEAAYLVAFRCAVMLANCLGAYCICWVQRCYPNLAASKAAPLLALLSLAPDLAPYVNTPSSSGDGWHVSFSWPWHGVSQHDTALSMWAVVTLAFAGGATHFLCSPAFEGTRLKAVTMASTGHMHGISKLLYRLSAGETLKASDWEKMRQSANITVSMAVGAVCGAAAMHLNVLTSDSDDLLLVPVALTLLVALCLHDGI